MHTLLSNCHTHTVHSDGKSTPAQIAESALNQGFLSLGFSDHSPLPYKNGYAASEESFLQYAEEVNALKESYSGKLDILLGVEWDCDSDRKYLQGYDYVIGSVHQLRGDEIYPLDSSAEILTECVERVFSGSWLEMARAYYAQVLKTALEPAVDVVGHFDLITKFNTVSHLFDENDPNYQKLALECADMILDQRPSLVFEVNTGAMNRAKKSGVYPAPFILKHLHERGARITVTSDSHSADTLDFAFDRAIAECKQAGYDTVYYLTSEGFKPVGI